MPKVGTKPAVAVPSPNWADWGMAIVLSNLAEAEVMTVAGVVEFPHLLAKAGLPAKLPRWVVHEAHKLNRNAIDACLFRNNRPLLQKAPELTMKEALEEIERKPPPPPKPSAKPAAEPTPTTSLFD